MIRLYITLNPRVSDKVKFKKSSSSTPKIFKKSHIWRKADDDNILGFGMSNFIHFTPKGETINSENYCEILGLLKAKIKFKKQGKLSKVVILLEDKDHTQPMRC